MCCLFWFFLWFLSAIGCNAPPFPVPCRRKTQVTRPPLTASIDGVVCAPSNRSHMRTLLRTLSFQIPDWWLGNGRAAEAGVTVDPWTVWSKITFFIWSGIPPYLGICSKHSKREQRGTNRTFLGGTRSPPPTWVGFSPSFLPRVWKETKIGNRN